MRKFKLYLAVIALISTLSLMTVTINGEINKIKNNSYNYKEKLIRFHVLANSDSKSDQDLKLEVRDAVVEYLRPELEKSKNISESEKIIESKYQEIKEVAKKVIKENGYNYDISVKLDYSDFPTKQYSNVVLPAGKYKALKVIIGEGKGQNWWCVMFPPLCFVDEKAYIDDKTDEKLKMILTEEEYDFITYDNEKDLTRVKVKFKIAEIMDNLFSKES